MNKTEKLIKELINMLDNHTTDYYLTEDTDNIFTLSLSYYDEVKFIINPSKQHSIVELDREDEEPTTSTFTVDEFVTYVFS